LLDRKHNGPSGRLPGNRYLSHGVDIRAFISGFFMEFPGFIWTNPAKCSSPQAYHHLRDATANFVPEYTAMVGIVISPAGVWPLGLILGCQMGITKNSESIDYPCLDLPNQGRKSLPSKGGVPFCIAIFGQLTWGGFFFFLS
jgi:hypothetical protein